MAERLKISWEENGKRRREEMAACGNGGWRMA